MSYEAIQQAVRAQTGTSLTYEEDWHTLWDDAGIADGQFNERMLAWINDRLSTSYTDVNDAMREFAIDQGYTSWGEMVSPDFTSGITPAMAIQISTSQNTLYQLSNGTTAVASDADPVGYATDASGGGKHFIQATAGARPLYQDPEQGAVFDGSDDYLAYAGSLTDVVGSVCILFQTGATAFSAAQVLFSSADEGTTNNWFEIGLTAEGKVYLESNAGGTQHTVVGSTYLDNSTDYLLTVVHDGTDYYVQVNSTEQNPLFIENVGTAAWFGDVTGADNLVIGGTVTSAGLVRPFEGVIYYVDVYSEDITA